MCKDQAERRDATYLSTSMISLKPRIAIATIAQGGGSLLLPRL
jgi:hypothetical protein